MTKKQEEIAKIKKQITELEVRLEYLSGLPDTKEDELLSSFEDFPKYAPLRNGLIRLVSERRVAEGYVSEILDLGPLGKVPVFHVGFKEITVRDLIESSENEIFSLRGFGLKHQLELKNWMKKHNLFFLY